MRAAQVYLLHIWDIDVRPALKNCSAKNEQTGVPECVCVCICVHTHYVNYGRVRMMAHNLNDFLHDGNTCPKQSLNTYSMNERMKNWRCAS